MTTPTVGYFGPALAPEEVEMADVLADHRDPLRPTCVYTLSFADGAAYVGISVDPAQRLQAHRRIAAGIGRAPRTPGEHFVALHGMPELGALVACPTRRHAHLYEALLTDQLSAAGATVHGAQWSRLPAAFAAVSAEPACGYTHSTQENVTTCP